MCGVFGTIRPHQQGVQPQTFAAYDAYRALLCMQHRGQDAAGILSFCSNKNWFSSHKDLGLVEKVFKEKHLDELSGEIAIGHTRYATTGSDGGGDVQPLVTGYPVGIGMAHNGNIINYHRLLENLTKNTERQFLTHNDLEILMTLWCDSFSKSEGMGTFGKMTQAAQSIFDQAIGGYAVVGIIAGKGLFGMRDPNGIRPLILGEKIDGGIKTYALASESQSLEFLGFNIIRDVRPGELIYLNLKGDLKSFQYNVSNCSQKPCMFEWVYFSSVESKLEEMPIYGVRQELGRRLAHDLRKLIDSEEIKADIVCPVPDTSRSAAIALAEELRVSYREGLIKNRYVQRSFILKNQSDREKAIELKLNPVRSEVEGKNIILVDDSIVRGSTSNRIVRLLKRFGAKEITLAITCPPIRSGCFYGVDFPNQTELIAHDKSIHEIKDIIGVDHIIYLKNDDLKEAIGTEDICQACVNGKYPTSVADGMNFINNRNQYR